MDIRIYKNFSKRKNSTKRPVGGSLLTCKLKEETSIEHPTFIIRMQENFESINYVYAMGHYYFVDDTIILDDNRIALQCSQDVLATYKNTIQNLTTRVLYSSSNYDLNISDNRMLATCQVEKIYKKGWTDANFSKGGCYILSVLNGKSSGTGGIATYYALTEQELTSLSNNVLNNAQFMQQLFNQFTNNLSCIISCMWMPFDTSFLFGITQNIFLGEYDTGVSARKLDERVRSFGINVNLDGKLKGNYMDASPFSTGVLYLPFVGAVNLDLDIHYDDVIILGELHVDGFTGDLVYVIDAGGKVVTYSGNCSTKIPITSMSYNATGVLASSVSLIGSIVTANPMGAVESVGGILKNFTLETTQNGALSTVLGSYAGLDIIAVIYRHVLTDGIESLKETQGLCCNKVLRLGDLSGYVQTEKASISIAGRTSDSDTINSMLDSGIYLE